MRCGGIREKVFLERYYYFITWFLIPVSWNYPNLLTFNQFFHKLTFLHSHKKQKNSLETQAELAVRRTYVENQAILKPILLYRASQCKQTKEKCNEDCLWTHIFTFLCDCYQFSIPFLSRCKYSRIKLYYNEFQFVKETQTSTVSNTERRPKLLRS